MKDIGESVALNTKRPWMHQIWSPRAIQLVSKSLLKTPLRSLQEKLIPKPVLKSQIPPSTKEAY